MTTTSTQDNATTATPRLIKVATHATIGTTREVSTKDSNGNPIKSIVPRVDADSYIWQDGTAFIAKNTKLLISIDASNISTLLNVQLPVTVSGMKDETGFAYVTREVSLGFLLAQAAAGVGEKLYTWNVLKPRNGEAELIQIFIERVLTLFSEGYPTQGDYTATLAPESRSVFSWAKLLSNYEPLPEQQAQFNMLKSIPTSQLNLKTLDLYSSVKLPWLAAVMDSFGYQTLSTEVDFSDLF
jgi:hypothetical protein